MQAKNNNSVNTISVDSCDLNKISIGIAFLLCVIWCVPMSARSESRQVQKLLIFSKQMDYRHESTEVGIRAMEGLCEQHGIVTEATEDSRWFNSEKLAEYTAIMFLNTSGDVFNDEEQEAFKDFIQSGGGFIGIHGATTTEYDWEWFGRLLGGYFDGHPEPQEGTLIVHDASHLSTCMLPKTWKHFEEWYNFRWVDESFLVLISVDEKTYEGGRHGENHPISWYKPFEGGRMFYTALGHLEECYANKHFLNHVLGGILYAMGMTPSCE